MAKKEWPGQSPIGKRLHIGNPKRTLPWATVVGVVPDVRIDAPDQPAGEQWYFPVEQPAIIEGTGVTGMVDLSTGWIALRSTLPPEQMIRTLRSVVAGIDPRLALDPVQPMAAAISAVEAPRRFNTGLITAFALAALLLAALGIYAVIAFIASQRTQEIAVRMALGAERGNIARLVLRSGAKIAVTGCALGILGSLCVSRLVGAFLFEVSATNPIVYFTSVVLMLLLALLASALPAVRAAAADPAQALRSE
jgi:predicted lysophospholipase L1 biosynthesis ABC-type transport system permease subunit